MKTQIIITILSLGLFTAWPTAATPPYTSIIIDGGSPYFVPKSATVSSGAPIRWENPTATEHTITHLGYPEYLLIILGVWKILGVVALLIPKYPLLKEWVYAGFFFAMTGAVFSHIASGYMTGIFPALLLLVLTLVSWYFRPADRKIISVNQ